jgi:ankyrin repeat protein
MGLRRTRALQEVLLPGAVASFRREVAEVMLACGVSLHSAAFNGGAELVDVLFGHAADVNPEKNEGESPLAVAPEKDHSSAVDLIRRHGGKSYV